MVASKRRLQHDWLRSVNEAESNRERMWSSADFRIATSAYSLLRRTQILDEDFAPDVD